VQARRAERIAGKSAEATSRFAQSHPTDSSVIANSNFRDCNSGKCNDTSCKN
jgi:hypothetical protein